MTGASDAAGVVAATADGEARGEGDAGHQEDDGRRKLELNEGQAIHSIYHPRFEQDHDAQTLLTGGGPWDYFAVTPYFYPNRDPSSVTSLAMLGSAICQSIFWLLPLFVYGPHFVLGARREEKLLIEQFPDRYRAYMKRTKMLLPFVL